MEGFQRVAAVEDLVEGEARAIALDGAQVLVCRTREGVFAVENMCSHQMSPLEGGKIRGCFIFCPLHGARFDLRDGKPIGQITDQYLKTFAVRVEDGGVFVNPEARLATRADG